MLRLSEICILASGWRRLALAFALGALGGLAMPPWGIAPVLFVSFTTAVWLLDGAAGASPRPARARLQACGQAAAIGWAFGFGYHLAGLWWLGAAFLVEPDQFAWALPLGVAGLPAVLACFTALGFALARLFWSEGAGRVLWFTAALTLSEFLRGTVLSGFPWNAFGMALGQHLATAQIASWVGLNGLTLLTVLGGALPACAVDPARGGRLKPWPAIAVGGLLAATLGFAAIRLQGAEASLLPGVKLRVMQPNIAQGTRFDAESAARLVRDYLELSDRATSPSTSGLGDVTHLIWPESPFPFALTAEPRMLGAIAEGLGGRATLLTGGIRLEPDGQAFNSLFVLGPNGRIMDVADKSHLVPFGEYLPASNLLRRLGLRQFVTVPAGFSAGTARRSVLAPGLPPVQPLICYEAIFPGAVTPADPGARRPGLLVNVTNDAWFGTTPGPYQHFAQARLRAIEEGLPLVRAANSGISAAIDPYGRILAQLPLDAAGVLDSGVPRALPPTPFALYPMLMPGLAWFVIALAGLAAPVLERSRRRI